MKKPACSLHLLRLILLVLSASGSQAQVKNYIGSNILNGGLEEAVEYYYTRQVKLTNGFKANGSKGRLVIKPIASSLPPSPDQNYVRVEVPRVEISSEKGLSISEVEEKATTYKYMDGLGRDVQEVLVQGSASKKDIVQPMVYDSYGRQPIEYLPYTSGNTGCYRSNAISQQASFYNTTPEIAHDSRPFTAHTFDDSPLNRVLSSYMPGSRWKTDNKNVKKIFEVNKANEVRRWQISTAGLPESQGSQRYYPPNQLWVEEVEGEDGQIVKKYTNGREQLILNRIKKVNATWYDTYYVYDDFGNLRFVLPPKLVATSYTPSTTLVRALAFEYRYDSEQRIIEKFVPGAVNPNNSSVGEPLYIIYDQWDREVMTQDGVQRRKSPKEWTYTKYDNFNRPIITGIYKSNKSRSNLQNEVESNDNRFENLSGSNETGYTLNRTHPVNPAINDIQTVTYYDSYGFKDSSWNDLDSVHQSGFESNYNAKVVGQVTGSKVRGLGNSWLKSVVYYDHRYREIQSVGENHLSGIDRVFSAYDFAGNVLKTKTQHSSHLDSVTIHKEYEYDHANRLLKEYSTINIQPRVLVASHEYNELGELVEKNIHSTNNGSSFLQSIDHRYNIRGWLTDINHHQLINDGTINDDSNDLFGMRLSYNQDQYTVNGNPINKQYGGNIAGVKWSTNNLVDATDEQGYSYDYDKLDRLTRATYGKNTGNDTSFGGSQYYSMSASYDENGNILALNRNGNLNGTQISMDRMSYAYENGNKSNRLLRVTDNGRDDKGFKDTGEAGRIYWYDENGNLTADNYKEIVAIDYNYLNLPTQVTFLNGKTITYEYDGTGTKLRKTVTNGTEPIVTDYLGMAQYQDDRLEFLFTSEGRAIKYTDAFHYEYFLKDHLGNTRLTFGNLPNSSTYLADMEGGDSDSEFAFPSPDPRAATQNKTLGGRKSTVLNGQTKPVGPAKVLSIKQGDEVQIEFWAKYEDTGWDNEVIPAITNMVLSAFGVSSVGTSAESASGSLSNVLSNPGINGLFSGNSGGRPRAYLQYIFFDKNYTFKEANSGFLAVVSTSADVYAKRSTEDTGPLRFSEDGYLFVYLVNESDHNKNVYFDDLKIVHQKSSTSLQVTQVADYYPFGLTFNDWTSSSSAEENLYKYNGKEEQLAWGVLDYGARMHDPALGRWFNLDPLADQMRRHSPYSYAFNNPIRFIDPDGMMPTNHKPEYHVTSTHDGRDIITETLTKTTSYTRTLVKGSTEYYSALGKSTINTTLGNGVNGNITITETTKTTKTTTVEIEYDAAGNEVGRVYGSSTRTQTNKKIKVYGENGKFSGEGDDRSDVVTQNEVSLSENMIGLVSDAVNYRKTNKRSITNRHENAKSIQSQTRAASVWNTVTWVVSAPFIKYKPEVAGVIWLGTKAIESSLDKGIEYMKNDITARPCNECTKRILPRN